MQRTIERVQGWNEFRPSNRRLRYIAAGEHAAARRPINAATFSALAFLLEFGVVVALALTTGVLYHLAAYGSAEASSFYLQVGVLGAAVYAIANTARGDYRLGNFLGGKVHHPPSCSSTGTARSSACWRSASWRRLSVIYSRAWIVLFYVSGLLLLVPLRRLLTRATLYASRNGIVSAKRIFIVGATPRVSAFLQRYQPSQLGVEVAGCCFLPLLPGRLSEGGSEVLTRELEFALIQAREANPDAIVLLAPWTATDAVKQTAEKFGVLPAELHLGPDGMLEEFTNAELLRLGPISTLQLTSAPLGTLQWLTKRFLDVALAAVALVDAVAAAGGGDVAGAARRRAGVLPAAALRLQPGNILDREVPHHARHGRRARAAAGHARRRPRDAARALAAALEHRRAAAAHQRDQRRHVAGRSAAARARRTTSNTRRRSGSMRGATT